MIPGLIYNGLNVNIQFIFSQYLSHLLFVLRRALNKFSQKRPLVRPEKLLILLSEHYGNFHSRLPNFTRKYERTSGFFEPWTRSSPSACFLGRKLSRSQRINFVPTFYFFFYVWSCCTLLQTDTCTNYSL